MYGGVRPKRGYYHSIKTVCRFTVDNVAYRFSRLIDVYLHWLNFHSLIGYSSPPDSSFTSPRIFSQTLVSMPPRRFKPVHCDDGLHLAISLVQTSACPKRLQPPKVFAALARRIFREHACQKPTSVASRIVPHRLAWVIRLTKHGAIANVGLIAVRFNSH
jgi:hypothetical protein